ncbi:hypothetical protein [Pseudomonas sp. S09G 359]|uniref:hypothetical protein n=1 Tax=Pseudomonas sp. S09G 359 TaxID=2054919 RepID=UPI000C6DA30C|nr:hypothetical protein [Pseudomonas sp. S09G 359]AUG06431.1 hypothetical protein CXQ82_07440 [Pseudomonas sp. S09G 359]
MTKYSRQPKGRPADTQKAAGATQVQPAPALPPIIHTLPDDAADPDQNNLVSADQQINGLPVTIPLWPNATPFLGESDELIMYIDDIPVSLTSVPGPVVGSQDITVNTPSLRVHGRKIFKYSVRLHGAIDQAFSDPTSIFVDTHDPNNEFTPSALLLPVDLPSNGVTPEYLAANGGVTFTLPRPSDARGGDRYKVFYGVNDSDGKEGAALVPGPTLVTYTTAEILGFGEGSFLLRYQYIDRAGNDTDLSIGRNLPVTFNPAPAVSAPVVVQGPTVDRQEARDGVVVRVDSITNHLPDDFLAATWAGRRFYHQRLGTSPTMPMNLFPQYEDIAAGGEFYPGTVLLAVERGIESYPSPPTTVNVDLTVPGGPIVGPGPIDITLVLPEVIGDSAVPNSLVALDLAGEIHATFLMYAGHATDEVIDLYYGTGTGTLVATYTVQSTDSDTTVVDLMIPVDEVEAYGNGDIPCWYRVSNAVNYKQSQPQTVRVEAFALGKLSDPEFARLNIFGRIDCPETPWLGVPIRVFDPLLLKEGDLVTITAVNYAYTGPNPSPTPPAVIDSEVNTDPIPIGPEEVANGFTHNFMLPYFYGDAIDLTKNVGWVEVTWTLFRPSPIPMRGTSDPVHVIWSVRSGSSVGHCVPITLGGSLV